jgi:hypothetical protein
VSALSQLDARVCCIELICSTGELEQRIASADRSQFGKVNSIERFRQLNSTGAFPRLTMPPEAITVDTSGLSAEESVAVLDGHANSAKCAV